MSLDKGGPDTTGVAAAVKAAKDPLVQAGIAGIGFPVVGLAFILVFTKLPTLHLLMVLVAFLVLVLASLRVVINGYLQALRIKQQGNSARNPPDR